MNIEQEIRAQIEKNKGLKLAVGEINNHLSILEGLLRNERDDAQKQVDEAYQKGYDKGYADKTNNDEVGKELAKDVYQRGLEDGRNETWEAARKIGHASQMQLEDMGFKFNSNEWFYNPSWYVVMNYTAAEAIEKIKAYEEKQKIKVEKTEAEE